MSRARRLVEHGVCMGAAILFVIVVLPLAAIAAILLRPLLLSAAIVAGLGAVVGYCFNPRFRDWFRRRPGLSSSPLMTLPERE